MIRIAIGLGRCLVVLGFVVLGACASFPSGDLNLDSAAIYRSDVSKPVATYVKLSFMDTDDGKKNKEVNVLNNLRKNKQVLERLLVDTGCCFIVDSPLDAEIVFDGLFEYYYHQMPTPLAIASGISFTIIPYWVKDDIIFSLDVYKNGELQYSNYGIEGAMNTVLWLPFWVLAPFKTAFNVRQEINQAMFNSVLTDYFAKHGGVNNDT